MHLCVKYDFILSDITYFAFLSQLGYKLGSMNVYNAKGFYDTGRISATKTAIV